MKPAFTRWGFVLALLLMSASPAMGQARSCLDRAELLDRFEARYQEVPVARALMNTGGILEVLSTGDGATWSVIVTLPNGTSCIVAAGNYWQAITPVAGDAS